MKSSALERRWREKEERKRGGEEEEEEKVNHKKNSTFSPVPSFELLLSFLRKHCVLHPLRPNMSSRGYFYAFIMP
jgi:hypothetical protein